MNPTVDRDLCIGCGLCADLAPDVFELSDEGFSEVVGEVSTDSLDSVRDAAESCPTCAIALEG